MLGIPFSKSCWVKGMIASRTTTEVTEATQKVLGIMAEAIAPPRPEGTASSKARMLQEFKKTVTQRVQVRHDAMMAAVHEPSVPRPAPHPRHARACRAAPMCARSSPRSPPSTGRT